RWRSRSAGWKRHEKAAPTLIAGPVATHAKPADEAFARSKKTDTHPSERHGRPENSQGQCQGHQRRPYDRTDQGIEQKPDPDRGQNQGKAPGLSASSANRTSDRRAFGEVDRCGTDGRFFIVPNARKLWILPEVGQDALGSLIHIQPPSWFEQ